MKKQKPTLQEKLIKREYRPPNRFFNWIYHLVMGKIGLKKYHPEVIYRDDPRKEKGPCILLWNHLSRLDHAFVSRATYPIRYSMVAEYNEFFRSHLAFLFKIMHILPKKNFCVDYFGIKAILSIVGQGGSPALAPEGLASVTGYNERIISGLGKLVKRANLPVYFMEFHGQGLAAPVYSPYNRSGGKTEVIVRKMFSTEQLKTLTPLQIEETVQTAVSHDEYLWQKEHRYEWNTHGKGCEHLHEVCYKCPDCGTEFQMIGEGDVLRCRHCGLELTMNRYLELIPNRTIDFLPENPSAWALWERQHVIREIRADPNYSFGGKMKIGNIPEYRLVRGKHRSTEIVGEGTFTADHTGIHFDGVRNGVPCRFDLSYNDHYRLIQNINTACFALYVQGEYFEFFPEEPIVCKLDFVVQEMHRLHVNHWKPLPEHLYLYEGCELPGDGSSR